MECLNPIVAGWLNGLDYSLRRLRRPRFGQLVEGLSRAAGQRVGSVREAYEVHDGPRPVVATKTAAVPPPAAFDARAPFLRACRELQQYVNDTFSARELLGFYVHGSLATGDYVEGYSDFDTLVVVRREVLQDPQWAEDFRRRLERSNAFLGLLDPLQHHAHFVLSEHDLEHHFEPLFPTVLLEYARELTTYGNQLVFRCHDAAELMQSQLAHRRFLFGEMWPSRRPLSAYDVKTAIQNIALLPAIYLQLRTGEFRYKRDTFEAARPHFDPETWSVVDRASRVRRDCPYRSRYPYWLRRWVGLHLHYKWLHVLHRFADRDNAAEMEAIAGDRYLDDAFQLTVAMERACSGV